MREQAEQADLFAPEPIGPSPHAAGIDPKPCRACQAPMLWVEGEATRKSPDGSRIPLNPEPDAKGNIVFTGPGRVRYLRSGEWLPDGPSTPRYTSHFSDCPSAKDFRRKR